MAESGDAVYYMIRRIAAATDLEIVCCGETGGTEQDCRTAAEHMGSYSPAEYDPQLRAVLMERARRQEAPVVLQENHTVLMACVRAGEFYCFAGPAALERLNPAARRRFYRDHGMEDQPGRGIPVLPLTRILAVVEALAMLLTGRAYTDEELIRTNGISQGEERQEEWERYAAASREEEEAAHHSWQEEQRLLACVREGRTQDALQSNMDIDTETGRMFRRWKGVTPREYREQHKPAEFTTK
ncbi:MAG: hypothetical protein Q4C60_12015 [Eubacteriales bacterium]|nr:hypothetical protein [Eubacteriales bacterium]